MGACLDAGIKVVSNAGGLDAAGCARAVAEVAERLGLAPRIACVDGDDLMVRLDPDEPDTVTLRSFVDGEPMADTERLITANAYLGGWGIAEALRRGADIVVTGRVTDAAVACRSRGLAPRLGRRRLGRPGRRGGGRARHRMRHPGHRR